MSSIVEEYKCKWLFCLVALPDKKGRTLQFGSKFFIINPIEEIWHRELKIKHYTIIGYTIWVVVVEFILSKYFKLEAFIWMLTL